MGTVQIWDAVAEKRISMLRGHLGRVGKGLVVILIFGPLIFF